MGASILDGAVGFGNSTVAKALQRQHISDHDDVFTISVGETPLAHLLRNTFEQVRRSALWSKLFFVGHSNGSERLDMKVG